MQGLGYGMPMFFLTLMRVILISVPLSIYFLYIQNQSHIYVWYSMVISSFITAMIAYPWMRINLKKRSQEIEINTILNDNEI